MWLKEHTLKWRDYTGLSGGIIIIATVLKWKRKAEKKERKMLQCKRSEKNSDSNDSIHCCWL